MTDSWRDILLVVLVVQSCYFICCLLCLTGSVQVCVPKPLHLCLS